MKATRLCGAMLTLLLLLGGSTDVLAQDNRWFGETGNWLDSGDWETFALPNPEFDARAVIGTPDGNPQDPATLFGVVNVTTNLTATPSPTVFVGVGGGGDGTLNIQSGGTLPIIDTTGDLPAGPSIGDLAIGEFGAMGKVNVFGGGTLSVDGLIRMPDNQTVPALFSLDGTTASPATVTAASAFLDRTFEVKGANVDFAVTGDLTLGQAGTHTWQIPAAGASTLSVAGNADLGGTLKIAFPDGTAAVGSTWNLIDAGSVDANEAVPSSFNSIDASAVTGLGQGQNFRVQQVATGATNGVFAQLVLEQHPILRVNRGTGVVTMENPGSVASVGMDVYVVSSALGGLDPNAFDSIAPADGWLVANAKETALSELNPEGTGSVAASSSFNLGAIFTPPTPAAFGQENEDVRFRFSVPNGGFIEGEVIYEGIPNNTLTLNVDPTTGEAQIINGTGFTVSMDTYVIRSASTPLLAGNSDWNSLQDQGASGGNWFEANSGTGATDLLSELLVTGGLELGPDDTINLGTPFQESGGTQDLVFQFSILANSQGDFNNDGFVDAADYTVWRDNLGAGDDSALNGNGDGSPGVTAADYAVWKSNFGSTTGGGAAQFLTGKVVYSPLVVPGGGSLTAAQVPEPGAVAMLLTGVLTAAMAWRGRR